MPVVRDDKPVGLDDLCGNARKKLGSHSCRLFAGLAAGQEEGESTIYVQNCCNLLTARASNGAIA